MRPVKSDYCKYAIIRYVPNDIREEFINIGLAFHIPRQGYCKVLFSKNRNRVRAFDDEIDFEILNILQNGIKNDLDAGHSTVLQPYSDPYQEDYLQKYASTFVNQIQFSEVRTIISTDPLKDEKNLFDIYIYYENPDKSSRITDQDVYSTLSRVFFNEPKYKKLIQKEPKFDIPFGKQNIPIEFDFGYKDKSHNEHLVNIISYDYAGIRNEKTVRKDTKERIEQQAETWFFRIEMIKNLYGNLQFETVVYTPTMNELIEKAIKITKENSNLRLALNTTDIENIAKDIKQEVEIN